MFFEKVEIDGGIVTNVICLVTFLRVIMNSYQARKDQHRREKKRKIHMSVKKTRHPLGNVKNFKGLIRLTKKTEQLFIDIKSEGWY